MSGPAVSSRAARRPAYSNIRPSTCPHFHANSRSTMHWEATALAPIRSPRPGWCAHGRHRRRAASTTVCGGPRLMGTCVRRSALAASEEIMMRMQPDAPMYALNISRAIMFDEYCSAVASVKGDDHSGERADAHHSRLHNMTPAPFPISQVIRGRESRCRSQMWLLRGCVVGLWKAGEPCPECARTRTNCAVPSWPQITACFQRHPTRGWRECTGAIASFVPVPRCRSLTSRICTGDLAMRLLSTQSQDTMPFLSAGLSSHIILIAQHERRSNCGVISLVRKRSSVVILILERSQPSHGRQRKLGLMVHRPKNLVSSLLDKHTLAMAMK